MTAPSLSVVMLGATGAVGTHVVRTLIAVPNVSKLMLLGRRPLDEPTSDKITQSIVDVFEPNTYVTALPGHETAICTLGVGQPSKMSKEEFVRIDKDAVMAFAVSCKQAGVRHFQLLSSVGANANSRSFYLRTKGELEDGLRELQFDRLSLFRPSMILTPTNRYGLSQGLTLAIWPRLRPVLAGGLRKYRGIAVDRLGKAIALNVRGERGGVETLHWDAIESLAAEPVGV